MESTFVPPSVKIRTNRAIAETVRIIANSGFLREGLPPYQRDCVGEVTFNTLVTRCDIETLLGFIPHESVIIQGYLISHVIRRAEFALDRLYPLFQDDRPLNTQGGCHADKVSPNIE